MRIDRNFVYPVIIAGNKEQRICQVVILIQTGRRKSFGEKTCSKAVNNN
jgi:hypothetical protein